MEGEIFTKKRIIVILCAASLIFTACSIEKSRSETSLKSTLERESNEEFLTDGNDEDVKNPLEGEYEENDLFELENAEIGEKVLTGVNAFFPDNWYKFYEDDDNIYLLYGDYYEARWLRNLDKSKLIIMGTYDVGTRGNSNSDSKRLVEYILNENNWTSISNSFSFVYPQRIITTTGAPTKEQLELVAENNSVTTMLRPHTEHTDDGGYGGCMGYWLGTINPKGSGTLYGVRGLTYVDLLDSNRVSNGYAFRPLVTISKYKGNIPEKAENNDNIELKNKTEPLETDFIINETKVNMVVEEYVLPNSNSSYLTQEDIKNLSAEELRIARNEVYARHRRRFQSQDLQEYFESKDWYYGTITSSDFNENLLNDFEKKNVEFFKEAEKNVTSFPEIFDLPIAPSKKIIDRYGYEKGYSVLSFHTKKGTLKDCGEYYQIDAVYQQGIEAPGNLSDGEQVTLVFNELTGETKTLMYRDNHFYPAGVNNYDETYYYYPSSDGKSVILYHYSEDRVDKPILEGKLYIRKDATKETAVTNQVQTVTEEILDAEDWYNGVYFDSKGYVTRLVFYGD